MTPAILRTLTLRGWTLALSAVLVIALLVLGYCTLTAPSRDAARQAAANATLSDGRTRAAQDASSIRDAHDARTESTRQQVQEATDAVRAETDPDRRDALARERLCRIHPGAGTC